MVHLAWLSVLLAFALNAQEGLLSRYEALVPYSKTLQIPMPTQECKDCPLEVQFEPSLGAAEKLLGETRAQHPVDDAIFLATPLGHHYTALNNFLNIQKGFDSCQSGAKRFTEGRLEQNLSRLSGNALLSGVEGQCDSLRRNTILGDETLGFMEGVVETQLENELFLDSLERSIQGRLLFGQKYGKEDIHDVSFQERLVGELCQRKERLRGRRHHWQKQTTMRPYCTPENEALVNRLVKEQRDRLSSQEPTSAKEVREDLNQRIEQINQVLKSYTLQKEELQRQWDREDDENPIPKMGFRYDAGNALIRRNQRRKRELLDVKKNVLDEYRDLYISLHSSGAGALLQTEAFKKGSQLTALEEIRLRWLGFGGSEEKVMRTTGPLPLLSPIKEEVTQQAMKESVARTEDQVRDLFKQRYDESKKSLDKIGYLVKVSPVSAGHILMNNPTYTDILCTVSQRMATREWRRNVLTTTTYMVAGLGMGVAAVATLGGALTTTGVIWGAVAGLTFSGGDFAYQNSEMRRNRRLQVALLNGYLSGVGDDQTLEEVRAHWRAAMESSSQADMALKFGVFDLAGVPHAARVGTLLRLMGTVKGVDTSSPSVRRLFYVISEKDQYVKVIEKLQRTKSPEKMGEFLTSLVDLSKKEQRQILQFLFHNPHEFEGVVKGIIEKKLRGVKISGKERLQKSFETRSPKSIVPENIFSGGNEAWFVTLKSGEKGIFKAQGLRDTKAEVLAYKLDRKFGFNLVPPTVERTIPEISSKKGSLQLFVEAPVAAELSPGVIPSADFDKQLFFDFLIDNRDRHNKNFLVKGDQIVSIDNGYAFWGSLDQYKSFIDLKKREGIGRFLRTDEGKKVLGRLKEINPAEFRQELQPYLGETEINDLMKRIKYVTESEPPTLFFKDRPPESVIYDFKNLGKKVVTFVGYSGDYEKPEEVLSTAKRVLQVLDPEKYVVNIGATPQGIGQIYPLAKKMGFETYGIISMKWEQQLDNVQSVDAVFAITDRTSGGYQANGRLSPTSRAMVAVSDRVVAIGGGSVSHDEIAEAIKRGKPVEVYAAEMNHAQVIAKAKSEGKPPPTDFFGELNREIPAGSYRNSQRVGAGKP